jgi:predicted TIM-barrel fold metal-dependent hydrolase
MATQVADTSAEVESESGKLNRQQKRRAFPIVDTDVHHTYSDKSDLYPYMTRYYAERFENYGMGISGGHANNGGFRGRRADTINVEEPQPANIGTSAIDVQDTIDRLLNASGIDIAMLTGGPAASAGAMMEVDYASAICRAFNDYSLEHWISADSRFRYALHVNAQDPIGAAAEIDRLGSHPAVCSIMLGCGSTRPFGNRFFHPIYEACERNGLAVSMHFGGEGAGINPSPSAAGYPSYYIESRQLRPTFYSVHVSSFVFEGVFEKFPTLKVGMLEGGFAWVPPLLWKMDMDWKGLRHQTPWVEKLPSEYVKDHIRFATQPMEEPDQPDALKHVINWMEGERTLMFATDYPHWDWDDPAMTLVGFPEETRRRIFSTNALETYGLTLPESDDN